MILAKKISCTLSKLIIWALVSVGSQCVACSTNLRIEDPGNIPFKSLIHNFGEQITAPNRFTLKQWWARLQKRNHAWINKSSPGITKFGGNWGSVITTGLNGAACKNEKAVQTILLATQAMITSGVICQLLSASDLSDIIINVV